MIEWLKSGLKRMIHAGNEALFSLLPRTHFDYKREVGEGYGSSVVMAPVKFIQRVFPEAPLRIKRVGSRADEMIEDHPMLRVLRRPNRFYNGLALWRATVASWLLDGNAYWILDFNGREEVSGVWWVPHWLIDPVWPQDGSEFISRYEYTVGGEVTELSTREVVHFRNGLDPRNPRLGMSDLHAVLREVFTDDEASNFTASVLRNMGVPGVVISPESGKVASDEAVRATKEEFRSKFTGDKRGQALVMKGATKVQKVTWSPAEMEVASIRDVSEERVCAILGVPAAVVGFGAGLQQTKVGATMKELVRLAWISSIIPMQRIMSEDLHQQVLPEFVGRGNEDQFEVFFDEAMVEALQESEKERAERLDIGVQGGWIRRSEARAAFRYPVTEADEVYRRDAGSVWVPVDQVDSEEDLEGGDAPQRVRVVG